MKFVKSFRLNYSNYLLTFLLTILILGRLYAQPSYVPSNGLKGWWSFTGNADDGSGNGNNGSVTNAVLSSDRFGNTDGAYLFDGSSSYISLNPINGLEINNAISISIWAKITGINGNTDCSVGCSQYLVSRNTDVQQEHFSIRIDEVTSSNKFSGQVNDNFTAGCGVQSPVSTIIPQADWHHIVLTYDGSEVKLFVDGILQGTSPYTGLMNPSGEQIFFGMHNDPLFPYFVNGLLDDIGIWDRALTACEIQQLYDTTIFAPDFLQDTLGACGVSTELVAPDGYTYVWSTTETNDTIAVAQNGWYNCTLTDANGCAVTDSVYVDLLDAHIDQNDTTICEGETLTLSTPVIGATTSGCAPLPSNLQNGLVAWWPFCGNANDESGNGNNGTVNGATLTSDRFGNSNSTYSFSGSDFITVPDNNMLDLTNNFSISTWFNAFSFPGNSFGGPINLILCKRQNVPSNIIDGFGGFGVWESNGNHIVSTQSYPNAGTQNYASSSYNIQDSVWYNYVVTYDDNTDTLKYYLNGALIFNEYLPLEIINNSYEMFIGALGSTPTYFWNGKIDDIGIWNRALTQQEIQQLYTQGQATYNWSTGDTTASISVTPTQTTTYYCTVDNGITSCTDSVLVTVSPTTYADLYDTVCNEYTAPSGLLYYTSGIYFDTIPNAAGCDSVMTIYLTVNLNDTVSITDTVCDMYTQDGQMFMSSGLYSYTIPTVNGCDSVINLDLTVLMSSSNSIVEATCSPYIAPDGQSFTSSGLYNVVIPNSVGCDSNITIDLTILSDSIYLPVSECYSYTAPDGNTYFESGLYTAVFTNQYACDSTIYIDLAILSNDTTLIDTACEFYTAPDGQIYTTSGIYTAILQNAFACDSTITIDLTMHYNATNTIVESVCETYTAPDAQVYTTSGIYTAIIPASNGCDSIITIDLTVNYNTTNTIVESACEMYTAPDGQMFMTSGIYTVTIPTTSGCDSVITIDLTIHQPTFSTINETVCSTYNAPDGQIYTMSGIYTAIIPNIYGCDSTITIHLSINNSTSELFQEACLSFTAPDGAVYTSSGTYTALIPTVFGCDSLITIYLTIFTPTSSFITETACSSYTAPDGQIYTSSGTYTAMIMNAGGCDSIITIDLTINQPTQSTISQSACTQYTAPDGQVYFLPGTYVAVIPNAAGCDSVITINLQINSTTATITDTQCLFYIAPDGQTYTTSGQYLAVIPNSVGCDSIIAINLTIVDTAECTDDADHDGVIDNLEILDGTNPLDSCSYLITSMTLEQLSGADCDMDGILDTIEINNGTNPFDSCDPNKIGIQCQDGTFLPTGFSPNGIGDIENEKLYILLGKNVANFTLYIYDRWGHLVFTTTDDSVGWDGTYEGKPCNSGVYAYVLNVTYTDRYPDIKTGNITLIR